MSQGKKLWHHVKGLVTRKTYVQYESPTTSGKKFMTKVKVCQKKVKLQGQSHEVKNNGTMWKVLSQGIHMCNMKALSLLVRKLWPRLKFFKSRSNFKVKVTRSKVMVPCERSCHKEYKYRYLQDQGHSTHIPEISVRAITPHWQVWSG